MLVAGHFLKNLIMNIFEALRKDHETQRELLKKIIDTSGDVKERDVLFKTLKKKTICTCRCRRTIFL